MRTRSWPERATSFAALTLALVIAVGGCAKTLDNVSAQDQIKQKLPTVLPAGTTITSVECPNMPEVKKGNTFTCTVRTNGEPITVKGTLTDDSGTFQPEIVGDVSPSTAKPAS